MVKKPAPHKYAPVSGSERTPLKGARVIGRTDPQTVIDVFVKIRRKRELPELNGRPAKTMSRRVLANKYGSSRGDITKVIHTFRRYGLTAVEANPATRTIWLRGTVSRFEVAFQTRLSDYAHESADYRGRAGAVHVPRQVAPIVEAVFGLDNRRIARRRRQPSRAKNHASKESIRNLWYTPTELATRYGFPTGEGEGQTVGLLEFGGGFFPADLRKFCRLIGQETPAIAVISVDGTSTSKHDGDEAEVMLDVEVVAGVCPKAKIVMYFAHWTEQGWIAALDAVMQDQKNDPGVMSISWGNAEDTDIWTKQAITQINESLKEAAYLGITVCVAAGDDGSSDAVQDAFAHVDFPSASPYALSIGGTSIPGKNSALPDIVWKEGDGLRSHNGGSTGGGVSGILRRPRWQHIVTIKSVNPRRMIGRCVPDVAANADWNMSPYLSVVDGKLQPNGGTSAASPLWAGLLTRINAKRSRNKRLGYITPLLYRTRGHKPVGALICTDVVTGNNDTARRGGYTAGAGYDAASGWGTPCGTKILSLLPP